MAILILLRGKCHKKEEGEGILESDGEKKALIAFSHKRLIKHSAAIATASVSHWSTKLQN